MDKKLSHKIYRLMTLINKLANNAVENGDIDREEYELLCWHACVLHLSLNTTKGAKNADNKAKNKSGT